MHPDIMQAIIRDRASRMRAEATSARRRSGGAARRGRHDAKATSGSGERGSGRSG